MKKFHLSTKMVFTPPTKFNQNMINNKAYKKLYSDYEKIINNRSALYKLVEEYSETIKKLNTELKQTKINKDKKIEHWKRTYIEMDISLNKQKKETAYWKKLLDDMTFKMNEIKISKATDNFNELNKLKEKEKEWQDYANDFCEELEQKNLELENVKKEKDDLQLKYDNIVSNLVEMDDFIKEQDKQLTDYKTNNTSLAKEINEIKNDFKEYSEDSKITIERLREIITKKNTEIDTLKFNLSDIQNKYNSINIGLEEFVSSKTNTNTPTSQESYYIIEKVDYN